MGSFHEFTMFFFFFFFQAEDGIRDHCVTGVQTCALPISAAGGAAATSSGWCQSWIWPARVGPNITAVTSTVVDATARTRSEERRVGKECRSRWAAEQ